MRAASIATPSATDETALRLAALDAEVSAGLPYALFGAKSYRFKSRRQRSVIERIRPPPVSTINLPLRKTLTLQRSCVARASSRKKAPCAMNLKVRLIRRSCLSAQEA